MKNRTLIGAALLAAGISFGAQAQSTSPSSNTGANNTGANNAGTGANSTGANNTGAGANNSGNNRIPANNSTTATDTDSFSGWANDYSKAHQGRVSRQAYMDEAGRRWDAADKNNQGLTTNDIGRINGWSSTGSGMGGPGADKGK